MDDCELSLTDLLADPMTLAVMAADRVDPAALGADLSGLAWRLELARQVAGGGCGGTVSGARGGSAFREFFTPMHRRADGVTEASVGIGGEIDDDVRAWHDRPRHLD